MNKGAKSYRVVKKYLFIYVIGALLLVSCAKKEYGPASVNKIRLSWTDDPTTTMTIGWDQLDGKNSTIYYGTEDHDRNWEDYEESAKPTRELEHLTMNTRFCDLKKLIPNEEYYFVIKDSSGVSERLWFKTAPDTPAPFTCILGGDTKSEGEAYRAGQFSNKMVSILRPLFIIFAGDFTNDGITAIDWENWIRNWSQQTRSIDGQMFPMVAVNGNHENRDMMVLNKVFNAPYQNNNPEDIYFSLSFGSDFFHMISLNSMVDHGGTQKAWLENDLKQNKDFTFKIASYHKPFHPHTERKSENENQFKHWVPLFDKYGLDISVDGDSHMTKITYPLKMDTINGFQGFIRDDKNGTMYIGEGSWGASPRPNDDDKPWTIRSGSFNQIKWLQVFPKTASEEARIDIRTVITSTRDSTDIAISHVENVTPLTKEDVFAIPQGIDLFDVEPYGDVISYPFEDIK